MKLDRIEQDLVAQHRKGWVTCNFHTNGADAQVGFGISRRGIPTYRYWFGHSRVTRKTFQILTCINNQCPTYQSTMRSWLIHAGELKPSISIKKRWTPERFCLATELDIVYQGIRVIAREAKIPHVIECPNDAHAPIRTSKTAWDLFTPKGQWLKTVDIIEDK